VTTYNVSQTSVGTTAVLIATVYGPSGVQLCNSGTTAVAIGGTSTVTGSIGYVLPAGAHDIFPTTSNALGPSNPVTLYAILTTGTTASTVSAAWPIYP
jgi:hypothetical protein